MPAPVWKPHPYGATLVRSTDLSTTTQLSAYAMACAERLDWPKNEPKTVAPSREYVVDPSMRMPM